MPGSKMVLGRATRRKFIVGMIAAMAGASSAQVPKVGRALGFRSGFSFLSSAIDPLAGATGVWVASDYEATPRKRIKNRVTNGAVDRNLWSAPRRLFANLVGNPYCTPSATLVDNNATSPEGAANQACTLTASGSAAWSLRRSGNTFNPGVPGTYTFAVSARLVSGSGDFRIGDNSLGFSAVTATSTWKRFTKTITYTSGTVFPLVTGPTTNVAQVFEFCDWEFFPGSADLHPGLPDAAWTAPLCLQNMDVQVGVQHFDGAGVASGFLTNGSSSLIQSVDNLSLGAFTMVTVARRTVASTGSGGAILPLFANVQQEGTTPYNRFYMGYHSPNATAVGNSGAYYNQNTPWHFNGQSIITQVFPDMWHRLGDGVFTEATSYDGAKFRQWQNGIQTSDYAATVAAPSIKDLSVGFVPVAGTNYQSGIDIAAWALFPRSLSSAEVVAASNALLAQCSKTIPSTNMIATFGTSLTFGNKGKSYAYRYMANAAKPVFGYNFGQSSAVWAPIKANIQLFLSNLAAYQYPATNIVISIEPAANELNKTMTNQQILDFAADVASVCDQIRALGIKVVIHTSTPRNDTSNKANMNANRAVWNTEVRKWTTAGTIHVDGIVDIGASGNGIGGDNDCDSTTNYDADRVHFNDNGYSTVHEPLFRTATDPLLV